VSEYEQPGLHAVRPYLVVSDGVAAIDWYARAFGAVELERHLMPDGRIAHAKLRIGESIVEMGEHPSARGREANPLPAVGLHLYVPDVDETYALATTEGATGEPPADRANQGARTATIYDPFGLTWWLATPFA